MLHKKRKVYLLRTDHTVEKSRQPLRQLVGDPAWQKVEWALIPLAHSSASYIAVDGVTLSSLDFDQGEVRFHLQLYSMESPLMVDEPDPVLLRDYLTTSVTVTTLEELYNVLHNVFVYRYQKEMLQYQDHGDSPAPMMCVADLEVNLYRRGKLTRHMEAHEQGSIAHAIYLLNDDVADAVIKEFGLMGGRGYLPNYYFYRDAGRLKWQASQGPITLISPVRWVALSSFPLQSFLILPADDYDRLLRLKNSALYITPMTICCEEESDTLDFLPIAHCFDLPKYRFTRDLGEDTCSEDAKNLFEHPFVTIVEVFYFNFVDVEDLLFTLDNAQALMVIFAEYGVPPWNDGEDIQDTRSSALLNRRSNTALFNAILSLGPTNPDHPDRGGDQALVVYSDPFEDYPPNLAEIAYLLEVQQHSDRE